MDKSALVVVQQTFANGVGWNFTLTVEDDMSKPVRLPQGREMHSHDGVTWIPGACQKTEETPAYTVKSIDFGEFVMDPSDGENAFKRAVAREKRAVGDFMFKQAERDHPGVFERNLFMGDET